MGKDKNNILTDPESKEWAKGFLDPFGITWIAGGVGALNDALSKRDTSSGGNNLKGYNHQLHKQNKGKGGTTNVSTTSNSSNTSSAWDNIFGLVQDELGNAHDVGMLVGSHYLGLDAPVTTTTPVVSTTPTDSTNYGLIAVIAAIGLGAIMLLK